jgi:hypothetical protein
MYKTPEPPALSIDDCLASLLRAATLSAGHTQTILSDSRLRVAWAVSGCDGQLVILIRMLIPKRICLWSQPDDMTDSYFRFDRRGRPIDAALVIGPDHTVCTTQRQVQPLAPVVGSRIARVIASTLRDRGDSFQCCGHDSLSTEEVTNLRPFWKTVQDTDSRIGRPK